MEVEEDVAEEAADVVVWMCEKSSPNFPPPRLPCRLACMLPSIPYGLAKQGPSKLSVCCIACT